MKNLFVVAALAAFIPTASMASDAWCPRDTDGGYQVEMTESGYSAQSLTKLWMPLIDCVFSNAEKTAATCHREALAEPVIPERTTHRLVSMVIDGDEMMLNDSAYVRCE